MTTIKLKKNSTSGEAPSASDLAVGEVAVNTADGLLYTKHTDNSIKTIGGGTDYSLPLATDTTLGGIELFSDTDQSVAANTVTSTTGRTYGVQLNSDNQAVVNVPWVDTNTDTDTVYTHPNHFGEVTSTADGATVVASNVIDADNLKVTGNGSTSQFLRSDGDGTFTWATPADTDTVYTHPNHSGEVTSTADGATVIADNIVDEANLKVSNSPTNGYFLSAQSGNTGGLTWAEVSSGGGSPDLFAENYDGTSTLPSATGSNAVAMGINALASGLRAMAIGENSVASGTRATAIGLGSDSTAQQGLALGYNAQAVSGTNATALTKSYASGADSFAAAIANNTSSYGAVGANSVAIGPITRSAQSNAVALGGNSLANGAYSFAFGGTTSGSYSVAFGGTASGTAAVNLLGGTASGDRSLAVGLRASATIYGQKAFASGRFAADGDAQGSIFILRSDTTNATAEALTTNNSTANATNQIVAASDTCITFSGTVVAMQNGAQSYGSWEIKGLLVNDGGTTTLANSAITVIQNASSWGVALSADNTNNALAITVTGEASHSIRWVSNISTSEVTY